MDEKRIEIASEQLDNICNQINGIEKQYPFIVTTIIAVISIVCTIVTKELENFDYQTFFNILSVLFPILTTLTMCYVLQLFRQVALLRGYAAYLEEYINRQYHNSIILWNSKYINGFIENNSPNLLIMFVSVIATISVVGYYISLFLSRANIKPMHRWLISILFVTLLLIIAYQFSRNDRYRSLSYWKAKSENENIVRVFLYSECKWLICKSGVGKALTLQKRALEKNNIYYTTKKNDFFNVIHINTFGIRSLYLAKKYKRKNIKVIITAHTIVEDFKNSFRFTYRKTIQELFRAWLKNYYSNADILIAPTQYVKDLLQSEKYNISIPIKVISNGVDLDIFSNDTDKNECRKELINYINSKMGKDKEKLNGNDKIIISVGLFLERKGILNFIELAKMLPEYKFIWFGHTSNILIPRKISKAIKGCKKMQNIFFPGYIEHSLLAKAYKAADLFLMLSYEETEGLVVLEALSSEVQTIINDISVYKDWLEDNVHCYKIELEKDTIITLDSKIVKLIKNILHNTKDKTIERGFEIAKERDLRKIGNK